MMHGSMIKTELLVPIRDNDGTPFTLKDWRDLEERLAAVAGPDGGYTKDTDITGEWKSGGKVYTNESRRYNVALESWTQLPAWLDLARWACRRFRQEAVYIEVGGIPEILSRGG